MVTMHYTYLYILTVINTTVTASCTPTVLMQMIVNLSGV